MFSSFFEIIVYEFLSHFGVLVHRWSLRLRIPAHCRSNRGRRRRRSTITITIIIHIYRRRSVRRTITRSRLPFTTIITNCMLTIKRPCRRPTGRATPRRLWEMGRRRCRRRWATGSRHHRCRAPVAARCITVRSTMFSIAMPAGMECMKVTGIWTARRWVTDRGSNGTKHVS